MLEIADSVSQKDQFGTPGYGALIALYLFCSSPAFGREIPLVEKEIRIPRGEAKELELGRLAPTGQVVKLEILVRAHAKESAGSDFGLKLRLNGHVVDPGKRKIVRGKEAIFANRLLNRRLYSPVAPDLRADWFAGTSWRVLFAPDFESGKARYYEGNPYRLVIDVTDLIKPRSANHLAVENTVDAAYVPLVGADCALVIGRLNVVLESGESPMLASAVRTAHHVNRGAPAPGPAPYRGRVTEGGGVILESGARSWEFTSTFSSPSGTLNRFTAAPGPDGVKRPRWVEKSETSRERASATAGCAHYRLVREVRFTPRRVLVEDRITNVTGHDLGMLVRHEVSLRGKAEALVRIAGRPVLDEEFQYSAPANPSVHIGLGGLGLGMVCDDDVLSNQAVLFHDGKRQTAGFYTDKLLVPAGQTRSLRWCVYPVASGEYYDFINLARQDRGANYTVSGPWYAFGGTEALLAMPREDLAKHLNQLGIHYAFELGGWVDHKQDPKRIGFGFGVTEAYWNGYRERLRAVTRKLKAARPGLKVLVYYDTQRDTTADSPRRFADSRLLGPDGRQLSTDFGGQFKNPTWSMVATRDNSFGKAMLRVAEDLVEDLGADGLGWDELENVAYGEPLSAYDMPDGFSCIIDTKSYTLKRRIGLVPLLGEKHRLQVIEWMRVKGKLIIGNGPPFTRQLLAARLPRFIEIQHNDLWHYEGNLASPLGFIGGDKSWGALVRALRLATLPIVARLDCEYDALPYLFPFTPMELHHGYLLGRERLITLHSGNYGWSGVKSLVQGHYFDATGRLTRRACVTRITSKEARTTVALGEQELAVLEKVPMVLSPGDGGAKVENLRYDRDGIEFRYSSASEAVLKVSNGLYGVPEGGVHQVLVNGRQHGKVIAKERELHIRIPAKERALLTVRKE